MAKRGIRRGKDNDLTVVSCYYQYLYTIRLQWVKHQIPVRIREPYTGLYLEGYIESAKKVEDSELEDPEVFFYPAFMPVTRHSDMRIPAKDVFPSERHLVQYNQGVLSECTINSVYIRELFSPPQEALADIGEELAIQRIRNLFLYYGTPLSFNEIRNFTNIRDLSEELILKVCQKTDIFRNDLITTIWEPTYMISNEKNLPVASNLDKLKEAYKDCTLCNLGQKRKERGAPVVFGRGSKSAKIVFIGEAPGDQEERDLTVFNPNAPAGKELYKAMGKAGINQKDVWITNSTLCRPVKYTGISVSNDKPGFLDIKICNSRLKNELLILDPKIVVLLGGYAYLAYYGTQLGSVLKNCGWVDNTKSPKVYMLMHPSYIARQISFAGKGTREALATEEMYLNHFLEIKKELDKL